MNRLKSMRGQYVLTVFFTLIALVIISVYGFKSFYTNAIEDTLFLGESNLSQETEHLSAYLAKGANVVQTTATAIEYMQEKGSSSDEILDFLLSESEKFTSRIDPNFTGIYGLINGEYLDGIGWVPPDDYVPKEREWYIEAIKANGKPIIVPPYLDAQTGKIMISVSQMLEDHESVISIDISLDMIQEMTEKINFNDYGYGFICDKTGLIIAHSYIDEKGKNYLDNPETKELINTIYAQEKNNFRTNINGKECIIFKSVIMDDWYVIMVINSDELFSNAQNILIRNVTISIITFVVIVIFCTMSLRRVQRYMTSLNESWKKLDETNETILRILAKTIDAKDKYTKGHSVRVAKYSKEIAKRMGKSEEEQKEVYDTALLHDIGKIRIPNHIINKPKGLTDEEYELIKLHPLTGYHILKDIPENEMIAIGAKFHHERYDGKGYPNGLAGKNIPLFARIIGVADTYDAMTSNRSYRGALSQEVVREEIVKGKGTQFDPEIADIMLQMIDEDKDYTMRQNTEFKKAILLIDDDPMNRQIVENILKEEPMYTLISTSDGKKAMEIMENQSINMVFVDVQMTETDGFEILKNIKEKYKDLPVVFMTDNKEFDTMRKAFKLGVEDYLTKPFLSTALTEIIHSVLN